MKYTIMGGVQFFINTVICFGIVLVGGLLSLSSAAVVGAQSAGDVVITEIQYEPIAGGDWVEVYNTSSAAVDMTGLKLLVGTTEYATVTAEGTSGNSLGAGKVAIIAADPSAFSAAYSGYGSGTTTKQLYKIVGTSNATFSLPAETGTVVKLQKGSTEIDNVSYSRNSLAEGTGASLHKTLGNILVPAPVTPGSLSANPITNTALRQIASSVSTSVTGGQKIAGDDVNLYLGTGDTITLTALDQKGLGTLTAKILIGTTEKTVTLSGDATRKSGTYTIVTGDPSGPVTYSITGLRGSDGQVNAGAATGSVYGEGRIAVVDKHAPTVTAAVTDGLTTTRKIVTVTIADDSPTDTISYKVNATACGTKALYDASTESEKKAAVDTSGDTNTATIRLFGTANNNKYVCIKATDKLAQAGYGVSSQITGLTAAKLIISEIMYRPATGKTEWIEITNVGTETELLTNYKIDDGGTKRTITHDSGPNSIAPGKVAVIANNPTRFKSEFSWYIKPLFKSSISLLDTKPETVGIRKKSDDSLLDSITYTRADGAYDKDGKTLHITNGGQIFEATGTPGVPTAGQDGSIIGPGNQIEEFPTDSLVRVASFGDGTTPVVTGQNLFFTKDASVDISFTLSDDVTQYAVDNIGTYLTLEHSRSNSSNDYRVTEKSKTAGTGANAGTVTIVYTVDFSPSGGTPVADNRITIYPKLKDGDDNYNTKRAAVVVVRNTATPSLANSGSMSVLGFSSGSNVIVPVTASSIAVGDWLTLSYNAICGDGLLSYLARNGAHGLYYEIDSGTYTGCTVTGTDSAGNASSALTLPKIIVAASSI